MGPVRHLMLTSALTTPTLVPVLKPCPNTGPARRARCGECSLMSHSRSVPTIRTQTRDRGHNEHTVPAVPEFCAIGSNSGGSRSPIFARLRKLRGANRGQQCGSPLSRHGCGAGRSELWKWWHKGRRREPDWVEAGRRGVAPARRTGCLYKRSSRTRPVSSKPSRRYSEKARWLGWTAR